MKHITSLVLPLALIGCAHAVDKPEEPIRDYPSQQGVAQQIPPPDAAADIPNPRNEEGYYEPLATYDETGDGAIDEHELGIASERAFSSFDTNVDAKLDEAELRAGAERMGTSDGDVDRAVGTMIQWDADDDGSLDQGEFVRGRFELLDVNRDNRIDDDEWKSQSWQHRYGISDDGAHPGYSGT
jgi:hypothetical protein